MKSVLIDTNIYCDALRGDNKAIKILREYDNILISPITIGELYSGFKKGQKEKKNLNEFSQFTNSPRVEITLITENTSKFYALIWNNLRSKGSPIPTNDIWIAASAMEHGCALASFDKHFEKIDGMLLI